MSLSFADLGVPTPLTDVLDREGKSMAFPIQEDTLPDTLAGRDVLGRGRTGSGKTLAFSIPLVARLGRAGGRARPGQPRALVLAPTRELATQIDAVIAPLAAAYGLRTATIFGGVSQQRQERDLRAGVDIVVACPGRLEDLMRQRHVRLDAVEITVLDEADHMADLGFLPGVTRIMEATPERGQRLLFSATLDNGVDKLVRRFLHTPVTHAVKEADGPVEAMTHHVFHVNGTEAKRQVVEALASGLGRRILFTRTKHQAKKLAANLTAAGIPAVDLHGNLSQRQRDRNLALFGGNTHRVLVATDVAARGVHVDGVELVVHVDPPAEHKAYLHRSGRTARAGSAGDVVTVVLPEQQRETAHLLRKAQIGVRPQTVNAQSGALSDLVGEVAPHRVVAPEVLEPSRGGGGRRRGAGRPGAPARSGNAQGGGSRAGHGRDSRESRDARGFRDTRESRESRESRPSRDGQSRTAGGQNRNANGQGRSGSGQGRNSGWSSNGQNRSAGGQNRGNASGGRRQPAMSSSR